MLRLSVLDQSPISEGMQPADALHNTVDLAQHTEKLGYHRYWVAEHHGTPMLACNAPEILIAAIADATEHHPRRQRRRDAPALQPAQGGRDVQHAAGLHPGRIDLGLGRAPGTDQITMLALQRDRRQMAADDFREHLAELLGYLEGELPADHPFGRLAKLMPGPSRTGPSRGCWAPARRARSGPPSWACPTASPTSSTPTAPRSSQDYRNRGGTRAAIGVVAVCAETDEEAERLSLSHRMAFSLLRQGRLIPVPPVEQAERWAASRPRAPEQPPLRGRLAGDGPGRARGGGRASTASTRS